MKVLSVRFLFYCCFKKKEDNGNKRSNLKELFWCVLITYEKNYRNGTIYLCWVGFFCTDWLKNNDKKADPSN